MKKNIEIKLNFKRSDFEEIYFRDNQGNYFKDPTIKKLYRNLLISLSVFIILAIYSIFTEEYGLFIMSIIAVIIFGFKYFDRFLILKKWKNEIIEYLDKEEKYSSNKLILTDNCLSVIQDDNEIIEKWENFKSVKILENYITLQSKDHYLIPIKSMTTDEYDILKKIISTKIK